MSVRMVMTTAMRMQTALTLMEVSPAPATLATLEMESTVQVSYASWVERNYCNTSSFASFSLLF